MSIILQIMSAVVERREEVIEGRSEGGRNLTGIFCYVLYLPLPHLQTITIITQFLHDPFLFLDVPNSFQVRLYADAYQYRSTLDYLLP